MMTDKTKIQKLEEQLEDYEKKLEAYREMYGEIPACPKCNVLTTRRFCPQCGYCVNCNG
jgi:hypothetical protein